MQQSIAKSRLEQLIKNHQNRDTPLEEPDGRYVSYTGEITRHPPESVAALCSKQADLLSYFDYTNARRILQGMDKLERKSSPSRYQHVLDLIDSIQYAIIPDKDGTAGTYVGLLKDNRPYTPILNTPTEANVFNKTIDWLLERERVVSFAHVLPSTFAYALEDFDTTKLQRLLDQQKYRENPHREDSLRSSNLKLKSSDGQHKVNLHYCLGEDDNGDFYVDVKNIALGLQTDDGCRDKLDVVLRIGGSGSIDNVLHYELKIPRTLELYRERDDDLAETNASGLNPDDIYNIKAHMRIEDLQWDGFQVRTDMRNNATFSDNFLDHATVRDAANSYDFSAWPTLPSFLKDPELLGGRLLSTIIDHVRENHTQLKGIYHTHEYA